MAAQGSPWKLLPSSWPIDGLGLPQQQKVTDRAGWILYSLESEVHNGEASLTSVAFPYVVVASSG
jgi:hypothetical protein